MPTRWEHLRRDYATCLRAEVKSPNTVRLYLGAVDKMHAWCLANDGPGDPTGGWLTSGGRPARAPPAPGNRVQ